jgi:hypothetical protein
MEVGDSEMRWLFVEVYGWMRLGVEMHDAMPRCVRHVHVGLKICCEGIGCVLDGVAELRMRWKSVESFLSQLASCRIHHARNRKPACEL